MAAAPAHRRPSRPGDGEPHRGRAEPPHWTTAFQIARDPGLGDADYRRAVIDENYQRLQGLTLQQAAQSRPALIRIGAACLVIVVGVLFWSLRPENFRNAVARIMLPLADVDPIYQTTLTVEPGDIEAVGDVTIRIHIHGLIPSELTVLRNSKADRGSEAVPVAHDSRELTYTFKDVRQSMTYAVRGGDFVTPYYHIDVPTPSTLSQVKVIYHYPAYTKLPRPGNLESGGGDQEGVDRDASEGDVRLRPARGAGDALPPENLADHAARRGAGDDAPQDQPDRVRR